MPRSSLTALRYVSIAEATSYLVLLVASVLKRWGPQDELGVEIIGPIHGALFVAYVALAVLVAVRHRWRPLRSLVVLAASLLPVAPFIIERTWLREEERAEALV